MRKRRECENVRKRQAFNVNFGFSISLSVTPRRAASPIVRGLKYFFTKQNGGLSTAALV